MSKTVYQDFDADALKYFDLETAPQFGVASNSACEIKSVIISDNEKRYTEIHDTLYKNTITSFGNEKRAFLLPRSPVSIIRIKSALKEHGIILTNDYTEADLIITHNQFNASFRSGNTIQSSAMMARLWNYETLENSTRDSKIKSYYLQTDNRVLYDDKFNFNIWGEEYESLIEGFMITGMSVNLAHQITLNSIPVIKIKDVIYQSATKQIINEQLLKDISTQIQSGDNESIEMAGKLLPTIDYTQNYHLLWELAQQVQSYAHKFNKNKDVQYWLEASNMSNFYHNSAEDMILWLEDSDELDEINFRYLEPIVRREIRIDNRNLYVFKVQVKPEYRKFLKNKKKKNGK